MLYKQISAFVLLSLCLMLTSFVLPANDRQKRIIVNSSNVFTSFTDSDCIYVITGEVDLKGKTVQIPSGSVLDFRKGSIINGEIIGNNTQLKALHRKCIGFRIDGTWVVTKIDDTYFETNILNDDQIITAVNALQNDRVENHIVLRKEQYYCSINKSGGFLLNLSSNTKLKLKTTISIAGNNYTSYNIIRIKDKENVEVIGGVLIGDVGKHEYVEGNTSQWGHGLYICHSKHVRVEKVTAMKCIGDGFTITGGEAAHYGDMNQGSCDVIINNVRARYNRRQGISIIYADEVTVKNSVFSDTGAMEFQSPSAGIDIEPNLAPFYQTTRNIKIINCRFERNVGRSILANHYVNYEGTKSISSVLIDNCYCDGKVELYVGGITVSNSRFLSLEVHAEKDPIEGLSFSKCMIGENGITLHCVNKNRGDETAIEGIVFNKCTITIPESTLERNDGSPVFLQGVKENINGVVLSRCKIKAQY